MAQVPQTAAGDASWVRRMGYLLLRIWEEPIGIVATFGVFLVFVGASQMADIFADLDSAQDGPWPWLRRLSGFWAGTTFLGFSAWYWTRAALMAPYDIDDTQPLLNAKTKLASLGISDEAIWSRERAPRVALFLAGLIAASPLLVALNNPAPTAFETLYVAPWIPASGGVLLVLIVGFFAIYRRSFPWAVSPYGAPAILWRTRTTSVIAAAPFGWIAALVLLAFSIAASIVVARHQEFVEEWFTTPAAATAALGCAIPFLVLTLAVFRDVVVYLARVVAWTIPRILRRAPWGRPKSQSWLVFAGGLILLVALIYFPEVDADGLYQIRTIKDAAAPKAVATRPDIAKALKDFADLRREAGDPAGKPVPAIIVTAEGGASRGAVWLLAAMRELDRVSNGDFGRHVFAISGVSGGSLGATTYLQLLQHRRKSDGTVDWDAVQNGLGEFAKSDLLEVSIATFFLNDTLGRILGPIGLWSGVDDRGIALEKAFERVAWKKNLDLGDEAAQRSFLGLRKNDAWLPHLLLNGTDADNGRRIITSTIAFGNDHDVFLGGEDLLDIIQKDIPVSTAVTNSARFPIISPAGRYFDLRFLSEAAKNDAKERSKTLRKIQDGGYYENYGAETAQEVARIMTHLEGGGTVIPIVVVVSNDAELYAKADLPKNEEALPPQPLEDVTVSCRPNNQRWYTAKTFAANTAEIASPLVGLYATRSAHGRAALENLRRMLCTEETTPRLFHIALKKPKPGKESAPMNWVMSQKAQEFLLGDTTDIPFNHNQACGLAKTLAQLTDAASPDCTLKPEDDAP